MGKLLFKLMLVIILVILGGVIYFGLLPESIQKLPFLVIAPLYFNFKPAFAIVIIIPICVLMYYVTKFFGYSHPKLAVVGTFLLSLMVSGILFGWGDLLIYALLFLAAFLFMMSSVLL